MAKKDEKAPEEEHDPEEHEEEEDESDDESDEEESDEEESEDDADEDDSDDEDDEDDEEDEDEDEDEDEPHAHGLAAPSEELHQSHEEDPTWWLPHAVLGGIVLIGVFGFFGAFTSTLGPPLARLGLIRPAEAPPASASAATPVQKQTPPAAPHPTQAQPQMPTRPPVADSGEQYGAKHLIVQYKGSTRSSQTRSKEEAQKRAAEALKKLKGGAKWDDIVGQYSDEPNAGPRHGDLGKFTPSMMDKDFVAATKKLKVGDMSDVVETQFGYHIIVRTF